MIILKAKKINTFSLKSKKKISQNKIDILIHEIKKYEKTVNYEYLECPKCNSNKLIGYGYYERNIGISGVFETIKIKRVYCKECGRTHAIIPNFIKPYFQYESSFIDYIVFLIRIKKIKNKELEARFGLCRQLIRKWKNRYLKHLTRLKILYCNIPEEEIFAKMFDKEFIKEYYDENRRYYFTKIPT